jgi:hypothetical protein
MYNIYQRHQNYARGVTLGSHASILDLTVLYGT